MAEAREEDMANDDQRFKELSVRSENDDFVLIVQGKKIYLPKLVLMLASPVFDNKFKSEESNQEKMVLSDDKKYEDVLQFIKCIHPSFLASVTMANVFAVIPLAHEYSVNHVLERCDVVLSTNTNKSTPVEDLFRNIKLAKRFKLKYLDEKCKLIKDELSDDSKERLKCYMIDDISTTRDMRDIIQFCTVCHRQSACVHVFRPR